MPAGHNEEDRKLFSEELKAMRKQRGWTQEETAARIGFSASTIANIESGHRAPTREQAQRLDEAFETAGTFQRLERRMRGIPFSAGFRSFQGYEADARTLRMFEHSLVPGLFQTEGYARSILEVNPETTEEVVKARVDARLERQAILFREDPPPTRVLAVFDEHVLNRNICDSAGMAVQMEHLAELARMPRISIQVIPGDRPHTGLRGAFVIAEMAQPPAIVYLDTAYDGQVVEDADTAEAMAVVFDALRLEALTGSASLKLIEDAAQRWRAQIAP